MNVYQSDWKASRFNLLAVKKGASYWYLLYVFEFRKVVELL